jgi:hypothetical protein
MPDLLPDSTISLLRSTSITALAAVMVIGSAFPELLAFAARGTAEPILPVPAPPGAHVPASEARKAPTGRDEEAGPTLNDRWAKPLSAANARPVHWTSRPAV